VRATHRQDRCAAEVGRVAIYERTTRAGKGDEHQKEKAITSEATVRKARPAIVAPVVRQLSSRAKAPELVEDARFEEVISLIETAQARAYQAVNSELVGHYWQLGEHISKKIANAEWGGGVDDELAGALARRYPGGSPS
jgi:hypothetical protein